MGIGLNDLMRNHSTSIEKDKYDVVFISFEKLLADENNFYAIEGIKELAENIAFIGLNQPLIVRKEDKCYRIIAGHRRRFAIEYIINNFDEEVANKFRKVPCIVKKQDDAEISEVMYNLQLVLDNSNNRIKTGYEKMTEIKKIKELLQQLKEKNKDLLKGKRTRGWIAELLNTSDSNVAKLESINNNLSDELKEEFKGNNLTTSQAYELSKRSDEEQEEVYKEYRETGKLLPATKIKDREEDIKELNTVVEENCTNENAKNIEDTQSCISEQDKNNDKSESEQQEDFESQFKSYFNNLPCEYSFINLNIMFDDKLDDIGYNFRFKITVKKLELGSNIITLRLSGANGFIVFKKSKLLNCFEKDNYFTVETEIGRGLKTATKFRKIEN